MSTFEQVSGLFNSLWSDIHTKETFPAKRRLLAHYTSIEVLAEIMKNDEVWFSNPLFMNDMEELSFVVNAAMNEFRKFDEIKAACGGDGPRYKRLADEFERLYFDYGNKHAFDTYVLCFSEHNIDHTDGRLSMWRGYGGNGKGAAIVINTEKFHFMEGSPILLSKVSYASHYDRLEWIRRKLAEFAKLICANDIPDEMIHVPAHVLFERIKLYSIFTKHHGFTEEDEWRSVYMRERDRGHHFEGMLSHAIGKRGLEPKFKYKVEPISGFTESDVSLEMLVEQIILGPSVSRRLAIMSVERMLEQLGKKELAKKIIASTTPWRPQ